MPRWRQWWTSTKRAVRWLVRPQRFIGTVIFVVGVPGLRDDLGAWGKWLQDLATKVAPTTKIPDLRWAPLVEWASTSWWPYVTIATGLVVFFFGGRIFNSGRWVANRARFVMAETLDQEHYIPVLAATSIVRRSRWGLSRRNLSEKPKRFNDVLQHSFFSHDPSRDAKNDMFRAWCKLVLDRFELEEPESVRTGEGNKKEYDEVKLNEWLEQRYTDDVLTEFGEP